MIKLVLFDIDGTLIRSGGAGVKAFARAFETEFGLSDGSEKLKFAGRTDVSLVREFFSHHGITPDATHFERFFEKYLFWLNRLVVECGGEVCPGVPSFLNELRMRPHPPAIGLLTGNIRRGAEVKLRHYDLWKEFAFGGFADDNEERDHIAAVAKERGEEVLKTKLRGEEVLVVGDTPLDIRCARAIGAKVLAVATGGSTVEELEQHKPDWVVKDLREIKAEELRKSFVAHFLELIANGNIDNSQSVTVPLFPICFRLGIGVRSSVHAEKFGTYQILGAVLRSLAIGY